MALSLTPPQDATPPERSADAPAPGTVLPPHYAQCFGCGADHPTGLHLSVTVAEGVVIGANSVVNRDVPSYEIWAGSPAHKIGERT